MADDISGAPAEEAAVPVRTTRVPPAPHLSVDFCGEGELVLLLHGVGGNKRNWRGTMRALAPDFLVAAWDARGYGESEDAPGPRAFSDFGDDAVRVLDHFGAARAHLVGLSMGGRIAAHVAANHPGRVGSLVLCDTHSGFGKMPAAARDRFLALRRDPLLSGKTPAQIAPDIASTLIGDPENDAAFAELVDSLSRLRPESYLKTLKASVEDDVEPLLDGLSAPTLGVVGALDRITPPRLAERIAERIPQSRLAVIEGAGHLPNLEMPTEFEREVGAFLRGVRGSAPPARPPR